MKVDPILCQIFPPPLFSINHDNSIGDFKSDGAERSRRLKNGSSASNEILNNETNLVLLKRPLDSLSGAVVLDLLPAHEHGNIGSHGYAGSDGEGGIGDAADDVVAGGGGDGGGDCLGDLTEQGRVGDNEAEVDVDWGGDTGFELEIAEFHGGDVVELKD